MPHVGAGALVHEGSVVAVRLGQADFVGDVGVYSLVGGGLCGERRIVLLHQLLLLSDVALLFVSLLITDHLQVLDLSFRCWWKAFLHSLLGIVQTALKLLTLVLELDDVGLAHGQF